jgi:lysozyme
MQISQNGLNLITSFEGLSLKPYLDTAGIPTIGYGTILYPSGHSVDIRDPEITQGQALQYLEWEVNQKTAGVNAAVQRLPNQNEFDALVSFSYNEGMGAFRTSTLLKLFNSGDAAGVADQFLVWDKERVDGVLTASAGLLRRRNAERTLFLTPVC